MKTSLKQIKHFQKTQEYNLLDLKLKFISQHIPRLHRFIMDCIPTSRAWFGYNLASNDDDPTKLTLLRGQGKNLKVVAKNF